MTGLQYAIGPESIPLGTTEDGNNGNELFSNGSHVVAHKCARARLVPFASSFWASRLESLRSGARAMFVHV